MLLESCASRLTIHKQLELSHFSKFVYFNRGLIKKDNNTTLMLSFLIET